MKQFKEHKSKTIEGKIYSTKKAQLIKSYENETHNTGAWYIKKLYKNKNGEYFIRLIDIIQDSIIPYTEEKALQFINQFNSLF